MAISKEENTSGIVVAIEEGARMKFIIPPSILTNSPTTIEDKKIRCSNEKFSFSAKT